MTAMHTWLAYIVLGLAVGVFSGVLGLGGGIVLIPSLVFLFGFTQHRAQGTTLAILVPPIGLLAAWEYYKRGFVDLRIAALIAAGFVLGALLGARFATAASNDVLKRVFGVVLLGIAVKMIAGK